jgi:gamma-glutamyl-gamma-aminobutyrate hydrolase PuuD
LKIVDVGAMFGYSVSSIFNPWGVEIYQPKDAADFDATINGLNIDLVMFGGGADIDPLIYNHMNLASGSSTSTRIRDAAEELMWKSARERDIPILGICRGAQFVCAKSGGKLVQDCTNHGNTHSIVTHDGRVLDMTSTHHQMMYPWTTEHQLLAWAPRRSVKYVYAGPDFNENFLDREPEVVYFPETKALGVQGHPEYFRDPNHNTVMYIRNLAKELLLKRKFI